MGVPQRKNPNFCEEHGGGGQRAGSAPGSCVLSVSTLHVPTSQDEVGRRVALPKGQFLFFKKKEDEGKNA